MSLSRRKFLALSGAAAGVSAVDLTAFAKTIGNLPPAKDNQPEFPRLGLIAIGYDQSYKPAYWPTYAKFHVVIIAGGWEGWGIGRAYTREQVVRGIKTASSIDTKVFQYVNFNGIAEVNPPYPTWIETANANNWWLYEAGTSGTIVEDANSKLINCTHFSPRDPATGLYPFEHAAKYSHGLFINGTLIDGTPDSGNAAPSLDGFFQDNVWYSPREDGDWNRDGNTDSNSDPIVRGWFRTGERDFYNEISKLMPGKMLIANNADWPQASTTDPNAIAPLNNIFSGGVLEGLIGLSYSVETYAGFNAAMAFYRYVMDTTTGPKLELVNQEKLQPNGSDPYDPIPYRAMRYGLCLTLMNNGYYAGEGIRSHTAVPADIPWFDEYDGGGLGEGYLGQPTRDWRGAVQCKPRWEYGPLGVWAREFEGGIAILNPKSNGPQTITLQDLAGPQWKHLKGTQDPMTNDGQDIKSGITLADRDGIILLRLHNRR